MEGPYVAPVDHPARLLDDYAARARRRLPGTLAATALRTRSAAARHLLARVAGASSPEQLLDAARQGPGSDLPRGADPAGIADLARVVALQNLWPSDRADGLALYDLLLARFGPGAVPSLHQHLHVQLAYHLGDRSRAQSLVETYGGISDRPRAALLLDLQNPYTGGAGAQRDWLALLRDTYFPDHPELALLPAGDEGQLPFDRLTAGEVDAADGAEQVSVIVTSFRPGAGLATAVRSLLHQSWRNLEVLVVDDGSPPEYDLVLAHCAGLDDRVRVLKLPSNGGTYRARNAGLEAAAGSVVTFQDSDDWSHPLRIEHQLQPLRTDPSVVATTTDGLRVTADLVVSRLGRPSLFLNTSSLMFRRELVQQRLGYFDEVRKSADTEYQRRIGAAFGASAVVHLPDRAYALIREQPDSLSGGDFGPGWIHPARAAYQSAYGWWHQQIAAGEADPYLAQGAAARPYAAPVRLTQADPAGSRGYDVVYAGDWRQFGGPQKSMIEEIRALTRRGMRIGVMQIEAFRFMARDRRHLCPPIQDLINRRTVDHVLWSDEADVSLLVIRYPPVLQFPPATPTRVRADQVLILANQVPSERDGTDLRYSPQTCTEAAAQLFSAAPRWCPQGPQVRDVLAQQLEPSLLTPFDMPGILDPAEWRTHRNGPRLDVPVIGRHSRDSWVKWPGDREALLDVYPDSRQVDVRVMGGAETPRRLLGSRRLPPNWLVYEYDELAVREFLYQLDFYVYFPHPQWVEAFGRAVLEALAAGCVVVLPEQLSATFGDAALYCAPYEVQDLIKRYYSDPVLLLDQSHRAVARVEEWFSHDGYASLVTSLISSP